MNRNRQILSVFLNLYDKNIYVIIGFTFKKGVHIVGDMYNIYGTSLKSTLSEEEQNKYLKLSYQGDYEAQQKLFEHNLKLVSFIVNQYFSYLNYNDKEEIFQIGSIGLWNAITKYNPSFNTRLSTYAFKTILGEIKNHFRDNKLLSVPVPIQNLAKQIKTIQHVVK